ncbi:MAG: hypothetical protein P8Y97_17765 [Candidatus Lokiarchaeota archaeon]
MEENPNSENKPEIDLSKLLTLLKEKSRRELTPKGMKQIFGELDVDETVSNVFCNSVKNLFDMGFQLANSLNLDMILDKFEEGLTSEGLIFC